MIAVQSTAPDGSDGHWLDQLAQVDDWKHTATFPGGDSNATFTLAADADWTHPAVLPGRLITAHRGPVPVWAGRLEEPDKALPWSMTAIGLAALAKEHVVTATGSSLDATVDAAISNGLPWTRPGSLTNPATPIARYGTLDDALGLLATDGKFWTLDPTGNLATVDTTPVTPTLLTYVFDLPPRTLANYVNVVVVSYTDVSGAQSTTVTAGAAEIARRGRVETFLDLTGQGVITSTAATAAADNALTAALQPTWTAPFTGVQGAVYSIGGAAVDIATIRPGAVIRVISMHADDLGASSTFDVPIGQVDYDDTAGTVALTALASARNDLTAVLAGASG